MKLVKKIAFAARRGIINLTESPAIILLYHRVTDIPSDPQQLAVKPDNFAKQLKFLKENYNPLSIEEFFFYRHLGKKFPKGSVLLTFDDGYADNYLEALPILEQYKMQALFYITTSNIDTKKELWWDELERILLQGNKFPKSLSLKIKNRAYQFKTESLSERMETYNALHPLIKFNYPAERERVFGELRSWRGIGEDGRPSHRLMTIEEIKKMTLSSSAVIGAHTHTHAPLSVFNYEEQYEEVLGSKNILEKITGKTINHFSYPFGGKEDYNSDSIKVVNDLNFKMVCSNYYGHVHKSTDVFQLPRILIRDWPLQTFKSKIKKFFIF